MSEQVLWTSGVSSHISAMNDYKKVYIMKLFFSYVKDCNDGTGTSFKFVRETYEHQELAVC
jgi:hypothetical protein